MILRGKKLIIMTNHKAIILLLIAMLAFFFVACGTDSREEHEPCSATLFQICDNYPKHYKSTMGSMSYNRDISMFFIIKNLNKDTFVLPHPRQSFMLNPSAYDDTCTVFRLYSKSKSVDLFCEPFNSQQKIPPKDSIVIRIHLRTKNHFEKIGIDMDNDSIENFINELSFESFLMVHEVIKEKNDIRFEISPNVKYHHGRLFIFHGDNGENQLKEYYDNHNDSIIYEKTKYVAGDVR